MTDIRPVERYDLVTRDVPMDAAKMKPSGFGEWVRFDDHKEALTIEERKLSFVQDMVKDRKLRATKKAYGEFMQSVEEEAEKTRLRLTHEHHQATAALAKGELPRSEAYAELAELQGRLEAFQQALSFRTNVERNHDKVEDRLRAWSRLISRDLLGFGRKDHYLTGIGDIIRRAHHHFPDL